MKFIVLGDVHDVEVEGEPFAMPFSSDVFAVHRSIGPVGPGRRFTASHVETGFAVGFGGTPDRAIKAAREVWASKSAAQREEALFDARAIKYSRVGAVVRRSS